MRRVPVMGASVRLTSSVRPVPARLRKLIARLHPGGAPADILKRHVRGHACLAVQQERQRSALAAASLPRLGHVPAHIVHALADHFGHVRRIQHRTDAIVCNAIHGQHSLPVSGSQSGAHPRPRRLRSGTPCATCPRRERSTGPRGHPSKDAAGSPGASMLPGCAASFRRNRMRRSHGTRPAGNRAASRQSGEIIVSNGLRLQSTHQGPTETAFPQPARGHGQMADRLASWRRAHRPPGTQSDPSARTAGRPVRDHETLNPSQTLLPKTRTLRSPIQR